MIPPRRTLASRACLGYTKRHETSRQTRTRRRSRPQAGGDLHPFSSKEQEKEGFLIPAQLKLLKEYAAANGFGVAQEYVDAETASNQQRRLRRMVAYLKAHSSVRVMLVGAGPALSQPQGLGDGG